MTAGMLLTLPSNLAAGAVPRARPVWPRRLAAMLRHAGRRSSRQLVAVVDDRKPAGRHHRLCGGADAGRDLSSDDRRARGCFRSCAGRAPMHSWRWIAGQFRKAVPFAVAGATELALLNLPVLLVSALVSDRVAVAQWGLTRVVAGLLRALCVQTTLPLAAELGHDHAVGATERLQQSVCPGLGVRDAAGERRGLRPAAVLAGFFRALDPRRHSLRSGADDDAADRHRRDRALDPGAGIMPITAIAASCWCATKGFQLAVFLVLSLLLIPPMGPLGAAIAIVASDLLIQFGVLAIVIIRQTLQHPLRHVAVSGGGDGRGDAGAGGRLGIIDPVGDAAGPGPCASSPNARCGWSLSRWRASPLAFESVRAQADRRRSRASADHAARPAGSDIARSRCSSSVRQGAAIVRRR